MLQTVEAVIRPDGSISLLEKLNIIEPTKVLLTLLGPASNELPMPARGSGAAILECLRNNPLSPEHRRSAEEIHAAIEQERNAWD